VLATVLFTDIVDSTVRAAASVTARGGRCSTATTRSLTAPSPNGAGAHTGEIELRGEDVAGIGVHIAARVAALADSGELLAVT
jgi:class 3 adenylate cyclase